MDMLGGQIFRLPEESTFLNPYVKNNPKFMLLTKVPKGQNFNQRMRNTGTKRPLIKYKPRVRCCIRHLTSFSLVYLFSLISQGQQFSLPNFTWEYRRLSWPRKTHLAPRDVRFKAKPLFPRPHGLPSPPSSSQECHSRSWETACSPTWCSSGWEITGYQRCCGRNLGFRGTWKRAALRSPALLRHPPLLST